MTYFQTFGTPSISRERLKLETSNLVRRLATSGPKQKNAKLGQKGSRDLLLEFRNPLQSSGTVEARNFEFGMQLGHWAT